MKQSKSDTNLFFVPPAMKSSVPPKYRLFPSVRFSIMTLLFLGCVTMNLNYNSVSFTIGCMVNATYMDDQNPNYEPPNSQVNNTNSTQKDANRNTQMCKLNVQKTHHSYGGTYEWDRSEQSNILAGIAWGAVLFIFVGGRLCDRCGIRYLYFGSMVLFAVTSFVTPLAAEGGWMALLVVRILQGAALVSSWPALLVASNTWFPKQDFGLLVAMATSGAQIGGLICMLISGFFCGNSFLGWQSLYYVFGTVSAIVAVLWIVFYKDNIRESWFISETEALYIEKCRPKTSGCCSNGNNKRPAVPWLKLLTSGPMWAIILVNIFTCYMYYFIGDYLPTYYKEVLAIPTAKSGMLSALPYLCQLVSRNLVGLVSDRVDNTISRTRSVKIFTAIAGLIPAGLLVVIRFLDCTDSTWVIACFCLSYFFYGAILGGFIKSTSYIAPQFTGTVAGISQTATYASAILAPYITGALIPNGTKAEWNVALYVAAAFSVVGVLFFCLWGSGEVQSWALEGVASISRGNSINNKPPPVFVVTPVEGGGEVFSKAFDAEEEPGSFEDCLNPECRNVHLIARM